MLTLLATLSSTLYRHLELCKKSTSRQQKEISTASLTSCSSSPCFLSHNLLYTRSSCPSLIDFARIYLQYVTHFLSDVGSGPGGQWRHLFPILHVSSRGKGHSQLQCPSSAVANLWHVSHSRLFAITESSKRLTFTVFVCLPTPALGQYKESSLTHGSLWKVTRHSSTPAVPTLLLSAEVFHEAGVLCPRMT